MAFPLAIVGAGLAAAGTIAGGNAAAALGQSQKNAADYQAEQLRENSASEIAAAQRQMLDTQQKTRLAQSRLTADAAGGGFVASSGSPEAISESIAKRGTYEAAMQLWQGQNASTGDLNKAQGVEMSGQIAADAGKMEQEASYLKAAGNLASAGSGIYKNFYMPSGPSIPDPLGGGIY